MGEGILSDKGAVKQLMSIKAKGMRWQLFGSGSCFKPNHSLADQGIFLKNCICIYKCRLWGEN